MTCCHLRDLAGTLKYQRSQLQHICLHDGPTLLADPRQRTIANVSDAIHKYASGKLASKRAPFTREWMSRVHKDLFGDVWFWAGKPRTSELNIGVLSGNVEPEMEDLARDIGAWGQPPWDLIESAATIHHRAVQIHPFHGGNGRWARLRGNIRLLKHGANAIRWPETGLIQTTSPNCAYS